MPNKFLLMGLPATGKTTTFTKCISLLQKKGIDCNSYSTDDLINEMMTPDNEVIKAFEKRFNKKIPEEIFKADNKAAAFMKEFGEEPVFRDLEEMFLRDILLHAKENVWFDFGGKAPLRNGTISAIQDKKIIPIFLCAEQDTIIDRLKLNDGWKKRANYRNMGEKEGEAGWVKLAKEHREDRLSKYSNNSIIIISAEKTNDLGELTGHFKTTEEVANEIFYRIKELELACASRQNAFTRNAMKFFNKTVSTNHSDHKETVNASSKVPDEKKPAKK